MTSARYEGDEKLAASLAAAGVKQSLAQVKHTLAGIAAAPDCVSRAPLAG